MKQRTEQPAGSVHLTEDQLDAIQESLEIHCPECGYKDWAPHLLVTGILLATCELCDTTIRIPTKEIDRILGASL